MIEVTNVTGMLSVDIARAVIMQFGGSVTIALFALLGLAFLAMIMTDARKELILLIPLPIVVAFGMSFQDIQWISTTIFIAAGVYLGFAVLRMVKQGD